MTLSLFFQIVLPFAFTRQNNDDSGCHKVWVSPELLPAALTSHSRGNALLQCLTLGGISSSFLTRGTHIIFNHLSKEIPKFTSCFLASGNEQEMEVAGMLQTLGGLRVHAGLAAEQKIDHLHGHDHFLFLVQYFNLRAYNSSVRLGA